MKNRKVYGNYVAIPGWKVPRRKKDEIRRLFVEQITQCGCDIKTAVFNSSKEFIDNVGNLSREYFANSEKCRVFSWMAKEK